MTVKRVLTYLRWVKEGWDALRLNHTMRLPNQSSETQLHLRKWVNVRNVSRYSGGKINLRALKHVACIQLPKNCLKLPIHALQWNKNGTSSSTETINIDTCMMQILCWSGLSVLGKYEYPLSHTDAQCKSRICLFYVFLLLFAMHIVVT